MMGRRDLLALMGSAAMAWSSLARSADKRRRIAVLTLLSAQDERGRIAAFAASLRALGYVEGQNIDVDYRYAEGDTERLKPLALELMALAPDVALAGEPSAARAVKAVAPNLPIVCPALTVGLPDLFESYARPGGTVTGVAESVEGLIGKLVELALEILPGMVRIGLLANPAGAIRATFALQIAAAASARRVTVLTAEARRSDELAPALDGLAKAHAQIVIVQPNGMFISQRRSIVQLALAGGLPTVFAEWQDVEAGGLVSYGVSDLDASGRAATYVDRILKGAKPGDLPIEFPTKIVLAVNLKTAKTLGITIPPTLLARADQVIE